MPVAGALVTGWDIGKLIDGDSQWLSTDISSAAMWVTKADKSDAWAEELKSGTVQGGKSSLATEKTNGDKLAENIAAARGIDRESGESAHHIVAVGDMRNSPVLSRKILEKWGMDINDAFNGVILNQLYHARLHSTLYHDTVYASIAGSTSYADLALRLSVIRTAIVNGAFPF